ncbi:MAG: translation initiation factor IF-2 [Candidatus Woesearchaeota archaeon]
MAKIRSPILSVLGHVDHGKSSILDAIRESNIVATEAGAITQAIGASIVPLDVIKKRCGSLLKNMKMEFTIPGLLFIDTPGHAAFTSLRKRGGALADIAILVVDINEGFRPQTTEAVEILKASKTPFVIAANKLDLVSGFQIKDRESSLLSLIAKQNEAVSQAVDQKIYNLVGALFEKFGFQSDRFDRLEDFTKQIAIVPCSAKTMTGISELLMVITGLVQKFLQDSLKIDAHGPAKGVVLEVKETEGLGRTLDVIIYDGSLKTGDAIIIGSLGEPIVTKVRALFEPMPLMEMRDKKSKYKPVKEVFAAIGVKVSAPDIENVTAGMPLFACRGDDADEIKQCIMKEIEETEIETDESGLIIKADTIGSLEALGMLLKERGIQIRKAGVGNISKKDIAEAESNFEQEPEMAVILGFNVEILKDAGDNPNVKIILGDVIYKLIDQLAEWQESLEKKLEQDQLKDLARPCKIEMLQNCTFRQCNPAIFGVEISAGTLKTGTMLMKKDGSRLAAVKSMQAEKESLNEAEKGTQLALSLPGVTCGRQINEGDILYSDIDELSFRKLRELKRYLTPDEKEILKEIAEIKRKDNSLWGV